MEKGKLYSILTMVFIILVVVFCFWLDSKETDTPDPSEMFDTAMASGCNSGCDTMLEMWKGPLTGEYKNLSKECFDKCTHSVS